MAAMSQAGSACYGQSVLPINGGNQSIARQSGPLGSNGSQLHPFVGLKAVSSRRPHVQQGNGSLPRGRARLEARALFNPEEDPLLQQAMKEPIAFFGGLFAGLLRLDVKEDPLREWVARTAEAAGVTLEEDLVEESDDGPVDISIE